LIRTLETRDLVFWIWCGLFLIPAWKLTAKDGPSYWETRLKLIPLAFARFVLYVVGYLVGLWIRG